MKPLFVFVGASGTGKSTLVDDLCEKFGFELLKTYTDRPKRSEDEDGHLFVTTEEIRGMSLLNSVMFGGYIYGMTAEQIARADICILEPSGAQALRAQLEPERPVYLIGLYTSADCIRSRLLNAGFSKEAVESRLERDGRVFENLEHFVDVIVVNEDLYYEATLDSVVDYIQTMRAKVTDGVH